MDSITLEIVFYVALAGLLVLLLLKKRRQVKDSLEIDEKNKPKTNEDNENEN